VRARRRLPRRRGIVGMEEEERYPEFVVRMLFKALLD
jgi:hypothetical protein